MSIAKMDYVKSVLGEKTYSGLLASFGFEAPKPPDNLKPIYDVMRTSNKLLAAAGLGFIGAGLIVLVVYLLVKFIFWMFPGVQEFIVDSLNAVKNAMSTVINGTKLVLNPVGALKSAASTTMDSGKDTIAGAVSSALETPQNIVGPISMTTTMVSNHSQ